MTAQLQVSFKNMESSPWVEQLVQQQLEKLERACNQIISCRVIAQVPHKHHHINNDFEVTVHIHVPDHEIVVTRKGAHGVQAQTVVIQAFEVAKRQIEDWMDISRGYVKRHGANGKRIMPAEAPGEEENMAELAQTDVEIEIQS